MTIFSSISPLSIAGLCVFAFLAGLVDSIAGGGGLIQLPALMMFLPDTPVVTLLATNKLSSCCGTGMSVWQYTRKVEINWQRMLPVAAAALCASIAGALSAMMVPNRFLRPLIILLLAGMIFYTVMKKDVADHPIKSRFSIKQQILLSLTAGIVIGFYDGFFGPGTGNFLILSFIFIFGLDFLHASASAKVINFATNIGALIFFAFSGVVNGTLGLMMAAFNMFGAFCGVRLAVLHGSRFIRVFFVFTSVGLLIKQIIDLL